MAKARSCVRCIAPRCLAAASTPTCHRSNAKARFRSPAPAPSRSSSTFFRPLALTHNSRRKRRATVEEHHSGERAVFSFRCVQTTERGWRTTGRVYTKPDSRCLQAAPQEQMPLGPPGGATIVSKWKAHLRAFLALGHQCFRRRTGAGLNFVLRRRLAHAQQETEQQITPQQGEIASC